MVINKDCDEDLIFTDRNRSTFGACNDNVSTHDVTAGVDNNYNNYNSNDAAYEDGANNE